MTELALLTQHRAESLVAFELGRTTSAADLCAHVAGFADLLSPPPSEGEELLVVCRDRYRFAVALLAAWTRGFSVALPPNAQPETIRSLRAKARTVIHDADGVLGIDVRDAAVVAAARAQLGKTSFTPFGPLPADRHIATVYTSGSTGDHAACPKTAGQLIGEAIVLERAFSLPASPRVLAMVPPHHIYGLMFGVLAPLACGGALYRHTPLHAAEVAAILETGVDVLVTVPAHLRALALSDTPLPKIERVFSSGAPLPPEIAREIKLRFGWTVTEAFGSSETGGIAWRDTGGEGPWTPFPGVEVSASEDGRIALSSPFVHPSAPRPYVGADQIEMVENGRFLHRGRADGVLKVGGVRVSLAEIEQRVLAIPGVIDAGVMGVEVGGARGSEAWLAVVAPTLDGRAIRHELGKWLGPVAMPRRIVMVPSLPREPSGKLPRAALEPLFAGKRRLR
jgi:acyl-coenzyme A synthetase/AMP-(fatty) acid ligase